ncbi:MAG: hypothetical protein HHJ19_13995 [Polaromonas sp.]|nr:hypothetical protein [Polaromonas sp.]
MPNIVPNEIIGEGWTLCNQLHARVLIILTPQVFAKAVGNAPSFMCRYCGTSRAFSTSAKNFEATNFFIAEP